MNYIVLDLEWNQPRFAGETIEKPVHLVGEIVQIGAVRMNERLSIKEELRLTVNPQYYRKMHRKVARITGLDNEAVRQGISFTEAFRRLAKFCGRDFVFLTWGPDDIPMLRDNLILYSLDEEWIPKHYDLQVLFSHQKLGKLGQMALEDAIEFLGEEPFQAHDALCDAKSTALICRHLDMKSGLRDYARLAGDIVARPLETKSLPVCFENRGAALRELENTLVPCPDCEEYLIPEKLVPQNSAKYLSLASCTCGREYLIRFRLFRGARDRIHAIREVYEQDEDLLSFYEQKVERSRRLRAAERLKEKKKRARRREEKEALFQKEESLA